MAEYNFNAADWWRHALIYQVLPASFQDSNGDGIGDIPGLISRLEHITVLGADGIWLSPVHPSPMHDAGYDIDDFTAIAPEFGTLADYDRLVASMTARGLRLLMDFVPNHTSDRHPWFLESRSSRDNARRDWYLWRDPAPGGGPPNNWLSRFGGSAWSLDAATGQYFFHAFLAQQPDLNWRNKAVRQAMYEVMRFWLRRGAAGFRVDASGVLIKDALLRDDPPSPEAGEHIPPPERLKRVFTDSRPEALDCLQEMRAVVGEFPDTVLAGEADTTTAQLAKFCGEPGCPRLDLPINFGLHDVAWDALSVQAAIDAYLNTLPSGATPNWALGGHDKPRIASRLGPAQARVAAMLHLTLPGTAFVFAGDEIGMPNVPVPPERIRDPFEKLVPGFNLGRDPERTPMRWTAEQGAGFTTGEPWLPIGDGCETLNVAVQEVDPRSMLALFRALGAARRCYPELRSGCYEPLRSFGDTVAFRRRAHDKRAVLVALNLGQAQQNFPLTSCGRVLLSTHLDRLDEVSADTIRLRPNEAVLILQPA